MDKHKKDPMKLKWGSVIILHFVDCHKEAFLVFKLSLIIILMLNTNDNMTKDEV